MKIKGDNVKYPTHCLAQGRHQVTLVMVTMMKERKTDWWPTFKCTFSVRPYLPPFPSILTSPFLCIDLHAIIKQFFFT